MGKARWRQDILNSIDQPWDILVIGGGITGAGIFREASRIGLKVLLVEQCDFAWGTSSRSSKLVHGGLRYLKDGHLGLTRASVMERERLLEEGPGLIDPLGFLLTIYKGDTPGRWTYEAGLSIYDLLALQWGHRYYNADDLNLLAPHISLDNLEGGFQYGDAQTDDARLVFRLIQEAISDGGTAINYMKAEKILMKDGEVTGAQLWDLEAGASIQVSARVVINATGVWVDHLRSSVVPSKVIRPLRGSHLLFPSWRLPVAQALCFLHPFDHRPVFIFPWEGITIVGTTDVDHDESLDVEAAISPEEVAYLMAAVESQFPSLNIGLRDVVSTFAGVRPVIGTGKTDPSQESRDHVVWNDAGLITVTGGKLTTFRLIALDVLRRVRSYISEMPPIKDNLPVLDTIVVGIPELVDLGERYVRRLVGRYGANAPKVVEIANPGELALIPGTDSLWAEVRWAARSEYVCHLDDLLLRRLRLGLLLPNGAQDLMPWLKKICQDELDWDDDRWEAEKSSYLTRWNKCYYLPEIETIPDWKQKYRETKDHRRKTTLSKKSRIFGKTNILSVLMFLAAIFGYTFWKKHKNP